MARRVRIVIETVLVNLLVLSSLYQILVYIANWRFWRQVPLPPADDAPAISAIIPLRGKTLDTLALLHLAAIHGPTNRFELLLVLEDATDPAYDVAQEIAASYPNKARIVLSGPPGPYVNVMHRLNAGFAAAQGDLIAFVEPNAQLSGELWNAALAALNDPLVGAVFAPPLVREPELVAGGRMATGGEMLPALHVNHAHTAGLPFAALSNRVKSMASGFVVVRRQVLGEIGGMLHLLDQAAGIAALGRAVREVGYVIAVLPVPVLLVPERETATDATAHLLRRMVLNRATNLFDFVAWPFTNPLTVGFILGLITEREGRWWGRRTWYFFVWLRMAIAVELDRIRFGRAFTWGAYAQLFMLDTFIAPVLWARALVQRSVTLEGRVYRIAQGGRAEPES